MNQSICNAIRNRNILSFTYRNRHRVVLPHAHGVSEKGNDVLRGYQTAGTSGSGKIPGWRLFVVSEITALNVTQEHFLGTSPKYRRGDRDMTTIYCEL